MRHALEIKALRTVMRMDARGVERRDSARGAEEPDDVFRTLPSREAEPRNEKEEQGFFHPGKTEKFRA